MRHSLDQKFDLILLELNTQTTNLSTVLAAHVDREQALPIHV